MYVVSTACSIKKKVIILIIEMQKFCQMYYKPIEFSH